MKKLTIKDAIYWSDQAWGKQHQFLLARGGINYFSGPTEKSPTTAIPVCDEATGASASTESKEVEEWKILMPFLINRALVQIVKIGSIQPNGLHRINLQAYTAFETVLTWPEAQGDTNPAHLLLVQKWRNCAAVKSIQPLN